MMTIYQLKPAFQALLRPLVNRLVQWKFTANAVTLLAMFGSIGMGLLIAFYPTEQMLFLALPVFLFVRMALNAIDGMMAREHQMCSDLGVYLNELGDIISDLALTLPFALVTGFSPTLIVLIVILSILTEVAGIMGCQIGGARRYDGPCGKSDRAFILGGLALLIGMNIPIQPYLPAIQVLLMILLTLTLINRIKTGLRGKP